jgi:hypothetical protein
MKKLGIAAIEQCPHLGAGARPLAIGRIRLASSDEVLAEASSVAGGWLIFTRGAT